MCILFCQILFNGDLGTEYDCNHWISYPKQIKGLFEATTILHDEVHASV